MKRLLVLAALLFATPSYADIVIGVSAPLTGPAAAVSEISLPGLKLAVADINARGGINGEKIVLQVMDDACDPKQAVNVADKLAGMKVDAVISVSCSNAVKPTLAAYEEEGLPLLASVASNPDLTQQHDKLFFRVSSRDDNDAAVATSFIAQKFPGKRVAIVDDKSTWGAGMAALIEAGLKGKGMAAIDRFQIKNGEQDYSAIAARLKDGHYDVFYPALEQRESGLLIRQMADAGFHPAVVGCMTIGTPDVAAIVGPAREGIYFTLLPITPSADRLSQRLKITDAVTSVFNVQSYAAVQIVAQAIQQGGKKDIGKTLQSGTFDTLLGPVRFDPNGDISDMKFEVLQVINNKPTRVWSPK